ncbi:hypothetical protein E0H82_08160 [Acinetobacter sp. ANC 4910]|uniref:AbiJ-NTD4 domain-containing protein n=1 Tax=Acinetobacter sp. ANC 4910 TaxID=2529850 RepID=UPI00103DD609|nr:hypothetical protein [Acinetobacter sp. ANC 4910]TCB35219.1 hypothetical protein E0H82_08160 [Acinetobacter sp. ANC 4910]
MRFSERYGYKPVREIIQKDFISQNLKTEIWNNLVIFIFSRYTSILNDEIDYIPHSNLEILVIHLWRTFFNETVDTSPSSLNTFRTLIRNNILQEFEWHQIYSFIEAILERYPHYGYHESTYFKNEFINALNQSLQEENSAYRIINDQIIEITSEQEIQSIEDALENTDQYSGVQQHLNQALKLMSDRQKPDYRNSIKESISGVEALAMQLLEDNSIPLGKAIPKLRSKYNLHPTLMESLNKLYGYSSDEDGVRHGSPNSSTVIYTDAKFMLVACTNFINYLIEKTKAQN